MEQLCDHHNGILQIISMEKQDNLVNQPRILVIDDDLNMREILEIMLNRAGYEVVAVEGTNDGLKELEQVKFDAIVSDWKLGGNNADDLLRELRGKDNTIPVIIISAYATVDSCMELFKLGAYEFIPKPFDHKTLCETVHKAINIRQKKKNDRKELQNLIGIEPKWTDTVLVDLTSAFIHNLSREVSNTQSLFKDLKLKSSFIKDDNEQSFQQFLEKLERPVQSMAYILERFRNTLGRSPGILRKIDIRDIIIEVKNHFVDTHSKLFKVFMPEDPCWVKGDREMLWHLFENLMRNAIEALEGKDSGNILILCVKNIVTSMVEIKIIDKGCGIKEEFMERIFEPNFTTKPKGLGIGLYLVQRAVAVHQGSIEYKSSKLEGTEFKVSIPIFDSTIED